MQCSELLETRFSVLKSVFCTPKAMLVCAHWTVVLEATQLPMARASELPFPQGMRAQRPRPFAQVTTCTKSTTVWFTVHPSPIRLDSDCLANLFFLVAATIMMRGLPHISLMNCIRGEYGQNLQAYLPMLLLLIARLPRGLKIKSLRQHRSSQLCPSTPPYGQTEP